MDLLGLHWLPQNSTWYELKSRAEQKEIEKGQTYVTNTYIYDSGKDNLTKLFVILLVNMRGVTIFPFSKPRFNLQTFQSSL